MGKKDDFLGMPHGTAANRLRKQVLFKYVKIAGDHFCSKCGFEIESVDDLSIEHIKPWEGRDVDLFWDLDNIAFSHRACNRPHVQGATKLRKIGPIGTAWCGNCQEFKDVAFFNKNEKVWNGLRNNCRKCDQDSSYRTKFGKERRA